jgi:hypothetical protein
MLSNQPSARKNYLISAGFCAIALALRGHIANDTFWLDEIWSYYLTLLMESSTDAFTTIRIDNNHLLNTLTIYWSGEHSNWAVYRLPALISGVATVALMGIAARVTGVMPWLAMLLTTVSLPLIQYSAEARGYSTAAMFGLAAWLLYSTKPDHSLPLRWLVPFWITCILGLLSHLTFIFVFLALGLTWLSGCFSSNKPDSPYIRQGIILFGVPALFLAWVYLYFYSQINPGGEDIKLKVLLNLIELSRYTMGAPRNFPLGVAVTIFFIGMMGLGISRLQGPQKLFFSLVVAIIPGLLLTLYRPDFFYPRYLLVCLPFAYLLLAGSLNDALLRPGRMRIVGTVILAGMIIGSAIQYKKLATLGKGDYPQAVEDMFSHANAGKFTVGSDFDFRNKALLDFYTRYRPDADQLVYIPKAYERIIPTDYFFAHNTHPDHKAEALIELKSGSYRLIKQYPHAGLSGWNWYLYHHEATTRPNNNDPVAMGIAEINTVAPLN